MGVILLMVFLGIVYFGLGMMKVAFEDDDPEYVKRHGASTPKTRVGVFILGLIILFVAWLFYMLSTGQI